VHHYEVIFCKSFKQKTKHIISTVTEVVQSSKYNEMEAEMDANNKIERHPLAKAGWYWSPPQKISREEVRAIRTELAEFSRMLSGEVVVVS
jgi:hypothetical protein